MNISKLYQAALATSFIVTVTACGALSTSNSDSSSPQSGDSPFNGIKTTSTTDSGTGGTAAASTGPINFTGFVLNAFGVTVDGQPYGDLEAYYTAEVTKLPELAKAAGYDSSYTVRFDANIGFADLWTDMVVYIAPTSDTGYQGTSRVDNAGKFSVGLPAGASASTFQVRANKRIGVVISKTNESHNLCYNFSAENLSVPLTADSKPIILKSFTSSLTAYDCAAESAGGLSIPANAPAPKLQLLSKGMSQDAVLNILGRANLTIQANNTWCWNPPTGSDLCAINMVSSCQCSVTFDAKHLASEQQNIGAKYLDVTHW
ncbi:MAG: hypothetical protein NTZ90_16415 [Proteobacteria bacterium]|nr:hypothetical protein [Pseudomonadota bacterium]